MSSPNAPPKGVLPKLVRPLVRPLDGKAWVATAATVVCTVTILITFHLWRQHGDRIVRQSQYRLRPERMEVTPQPDYIRTNVTESAVTHGRLLDASLLDRELVLQVKQAFGVQPWVRRVLQVNKQWPSTVEVVLEYRRPLAMVEVPKGAFPQYDYEGLLPIDTEGVLLPQEMEPEEARIYPKIGGVDSLPNGPNGSPWGDPRVAEAARIILLLEAIWEPLGLYKVEVPTRAPAIDGPPQTSYVLVTRGGRRYPWGPAIGQERAGERSAAEKAAGLKSFLEKHGKLDSWTETPELSVSELVQRHDWR